MINEVKDPQAKRDFTLDWVVFLGVDTISSSVWAIPSGLTSSGEVISGTQTTALIAGGAANSIYEITNTITTAAGRVEEKSIVLWVREEENVYATPDSVAALVPRWANTSGYFDATTRPTMGQVARWLGEVSGMVNVILANSGFAVPVTEMNSRMMLDLFVASEVASIADGVNGSGKFGQTLKQNNRSRFSIIVEDFRSFLGEISFGMAELGSSQSASSLGSFGFREIDNSGNETAPLFQREQFGETYDRTDV